MPDWILPALSTIFSAAACMAVVLASKKLASQKILDAVQALETRQRDAEQSMRNESLQNRSELSKNLAESRTEISKSVVGLGDAVRDQMRTMAELQKVQLEGFEKQLDQMRKEHADSIKENKELVSERVSALQTEVSTKLIDQKTAFQISAKELKEEVSISLANASKGSSETLKGISELQKERLDEFSKSINNLSATNSQKHDLLREGVEKTLKELQEKNVQKLDEMRMTVDEKLHGTLEKRLGESFKLVSDRLENVQKGLGEMQNLAIGVGDLKKVLTNVKARGTWGELQLELILEDMLSPEQYEKNVKIKPKSQESVEFAIRLPGSDEAGKPLYLPIDSKFPKEDYERLQAARDTGNPVEADAAAAALMAQIKKCAKDIRDKYISPPDSTDFAIMFLPVESLFFEVQRVPGLASELQSDFRVIIAGPTTLCALLTSLQMGFRTLAVQKRTSEVWDLLSGVKSEFGKFGTILDKVGKQLQTAQNTITDAATKTRTIERKLRGVQELPSAVAAEIAETVEQLTPAETGEQVEEEEP